MSEYLVIKTHLGDIRLKLQTDVAPITCHHVKTLVQEKVFENAAYFYRSDFVIQFGVHGTKKPRPKLSKNESTNPPKASNVRGAAAFAHWDVPDCGDTEIFINLKPNTHLDTAYGGFCVFANALDEESFGSIDAIAAAIPKDSKVPIISITIE
jgi:cyclophilin family peptidyl-prolyl cis-trans isomerase